MIPIETTLAELIPTQTTIIILRAIIGTGIITAILMAIIIGIKDLTRKLSILRLFVQIVSAVIMYLGIIGLVGYGTALLLGTQLLPDGLSVPAYACFYPPGRTMTCMIWQIQSYIFPFFNLQWLAITVGLTVVMSIVLGRFFCGWICPFGLYMDLLIRLRKSLHIGYRKLSERFTNAMHQLRYVILAVALVIAFMGFAEIVPVGGVYTPKMGDFLCSVPFCQVCPMRPLGVLIEGVIGSIQWWWISSQTIGSFYHAGMYVTSVNMVILVLVTIGAFFIRRFWCRMCPLGGLMALFSRYVPFKWASVVRLNKEEEKCTKCGICERVCPPQITDVYEEKGGDVTSPMCILCLRCVEMCPYEDCLKVEVFGKPIYKSKNWLKT